MTDCPKCGGKGWVQHSVDQQEPAGCDVLCDVLVYDWRACDVCDHGIYVSRESVGLPPVERL